MSAEGEKLIASNPNARANYQISEVVEAGIMLLGTEVKSLRTQSPSMRDAYVDLSYQRPPVEAWLVNLQIAPYEYGNIWNHDPLRKRKLLLHRHQIEKLKEAVIQKGMSIIPLRLYFKKGRAKVELGIGKGKKKYDKREDLKKRSAEREMDHARKRRG